MLMSWMSGVGHCNAESCRLCLPGAYGDGGDGTSTRGREEWSVGHGGRGLHVFATKGGHAHGGTGSVGAVKIFLVFANGSAPCPSKGPMATLLCLRTRTLPPDVGGGLIRAMQWYLRRWTRGPHTSLSTYLQGTRDLTSLTFVDLCRCGLLSFPARRSLTPA